MRTIALAACPACGQTDFRVFDLGAGNLLRRCNACDTVSAPEYADPRDVYVEGYLFGEAQGFGIDVRDPTFQRYLARVGSRRMTLIERATSTRKGSLLDVGCGTGEVALAAQQRGWSVVGIEPERTAAEMAQGRGIKVRNAVLEESGVPERSFDVVSAFHVLEHVPDSRAFLRMLARWARPGGFVVVEVPNFNSVQRRRTGHRWPHLRPLEHLVHFTPATLRRTLLFAGLRPILVRSPVYIGPPQNLHQALHDLGRYGRFRRLMARFSTVRDGEAGTGRYPSRLGWMGLNAVATLHDRADAGAVVLGVGRVGG